MTDFNDSEGDFSEDFYTLVPEQGLCLIGDEIVNLRRISLIRKVEGRTLLYCAGVPDPVALPEEAFTKIRDAVFAVDDDLDDDFDDEDDE